MRRSLLEGGVGRGLTLRRAGIVRVQRALFLVEPRQHVGVVAHHALLARDVGVELRQPLLELGGAGAHALRLVLDLRPGDGQPLQGGGGRRLRLAQRRKLVRADGLVLRGLHLLGGAVADQRRRLRQRRLRLGLMLLGAAPAQVEKNGLRLADLGRQVLEARSLPRLPLQALDLALELADDVVQPLQILLGRAQAQLRLVAAGVEARNAGRLLQKRAAGLRLGLDQLADAALPDHRRRARAGRLVGEEKLHVARAGLLAVDAVDRARLALDAARDLQFVGVVEGGGRGAVGIVEEQRHLGCVARRARRRAGEDDVVHAGRAHVLVRAFAHHPAQGLDKVGLAAAVRADDARQPALDDELARFDEGLEAEEAQPGELHARSPARRRARRLRVARGPPLEQAVDDGRHLGNLQSPRILVSVDEEGRRRVDAEIVRSPGAHRPDIIEKLLVRQAGLEGLL